MEIIYTLFMAIEQKNLRGSLKGFEAKNSSGKNFRASPAGVSLMEGTNKMIVEMGHFGKFAVKIPFNQTASYFSAREKERAMNEMESEGGQA